MTDHVSKRKPSVAGEQHLPGSVARIEGVDAHHLRFMQQLGRSYRALIAGFEAHTGHSVARWRILTTLDTQGEMSQKLLAKELAIDPAALTRQLKALDANGWVERRSDAHDARLTNVKLTDAGRNTVAAATAKRSAYIEWALGGLPIEQLDAFSDMLAQLEARVSVRS